MLSEIVRPLVRTQIRLLANTKATRSTLVSTIAQWLSYLGVRAAVTNVNAKSNQIQVSLSVCKPDSCDTSDWQKIINNLNESPQKTSTSKLTYLEMNPKQQSKLQRLLAYVIQVGTPDNNVDWDTLYPQLQEISLDDNMLLGIKSALKVPQSLDQLMEGIEPELAAIALPFAVSISFLDRHVNPHEDRTLTALFNAMK
ncbi:MAG: hypothetical protein F6K58_27135 [Symploca sp. SIO2E9]|nr:hypothetical protein [Symploca sp. SIO2E9]